MVNYNYTDKVQVEEYSGCWEDYLTPDEYDEILEQKRYNRSMYGSSYRPYRNLNNY